MPFVHVELYPGRTPQQKQDCARAIVEAIQKHLNAPPSATQVVFVDVEKGDWHVGDKIPAAGATTG